MCDKWRELSKFNFFLCETESDLRDRTYQFSWLITNMWNLIRSDSFPIWSPCTLNLPVSRGPYCVPKENSLNFTQPLYEVRIVAEGSRNVLDLHLSSVSQRDERARQLKRVVLLLLCLLVLFQSSKGEKSAGYSPWEIESLRGVYDQRALSHFLHLFEATIRMWDHNFFHLSPPSARKWISHEMFGYHFISFSLCTHSIRSFETYSAKI